MNWFCFTFITWQIWFIQANQIIVSANRHHAGSYHLPQSLKGEQIPKEFYKAIEKSEGSKKNLQHKLRHFLEKLQQNLTMSSVLSDSDNTAANIEDYIIRMQELSTFFYKASFSFEQFAVDTDSLYEITKNTSHALLLKLRQVPTAQPTLVKVLLTNYFAEMEFFHVLFSEIIDEALEYTIETLRAIKNIFLYYADTQSLILQNWKLKLNLECCKLYVDFLQKHSAQIFKCAAGDHLIFAYDVYAVTQINVKYILKQLEFRIQNIFNCFRSKSFTIRCKFLKSVDRDLENLFSKLDELNMFFDAKKKKFSVSATRFRQRTTSYDNTGKFISTLDDCLPIDFPHTQMSTELKECFYFFKN
ncbi:uncharacterized protein LOC108145967 [Drosophila elegans]|uniref:uncharacterized protein LOC108145967 n=1 Tax=Drosophila elegans TaxID=30023 RepID=UPI001BC84FB0|nr:uncharacterized protein LOC108145967 [Drosophila elegans]